MVIRRLIAALAALLLAGLGAALLLAYVGAADQRAMAGMETVPVLVVAKPVGKGTPAEKLTGLVTKKTLPAAAVAPGTVADVRSLSGRVATTDLLPGEQLLASRFVDPVSLEDPNAIKIPTGMQQLSLAVESQRILGGELTAGATVGVFVSLPKDNTRPPQTHLVLHKVLVTKVVNGVTSAESESESPPQNAAGLPQGTLMVTLATVAPDAEKIVFGAEHGKIWLSLQPADATETGTRVLDDKSVYE
jgi:pilus assembly protein CpaB